MREYYQILRLPTGASKQAIKKAYRKLAFEFHPDHNSTPGAQEKFIAVAEAYEMLMGERKPKRVAYSSPAPTYEQRQQAARARARKQAQMRFNVFKRNNLAFKKSWYYYPAKGLAYSVYGVMLILGILLLLAPLVQLIRGKYFDALVLSPLIIGGIGLLPYAKKYLKEIEPYFEDY